MAERSPPVEPEKSKKRADWETDFSGVSSEEEVDGVVKTKVKEIERRAKAKLERSNRKKNARRAMSRNPRSSSVPSRTRDTARGEGAQRRSQGPPLYDYGDLDKLLREQRERRSKEVSKKEQRGYYSSVEMSSSSAESDENVLADTKLGLDPDFIAKYGKLPLLDIIEKVRKAKRDRDYEALSQQSLISEDEGEAKGLLRIFTHTIKPLAVVVDAEKREDPVQLARATQHLGRISGPAIDRALRSEEIFKENDSRMQTLYGMISDLGREVDSLRSESRTKNRAQIIKSGSLHPNPVGSYPRRNAPNDHWIRAVAAFQTATKITERSLDFRERPYDYLLDLLSASNQVAQNFGLSKEQQLLLILNSIPGTGSIYKELRMMGSLENVFKLVNINCSTLSTKAELEVKIENWSLNTSSHQALSESLCVLKALHLDTDDFSCNGDTQNELFIALLKRIKRESLSPFVKRQLEEARIFLEVETNPIVLHEILLSALRGMVNAPSKKQNLSVHQSNTFDERSPPPVLLAVEHRPEPRPAKKVDKSQDRGRQKDRDGGNKHQKNNDQKGKKEKYGDRSKSRTRYTFVEPWPMGKSYLSKSGNQLSKEIELHFSGFCFKCGLNNHLAGDCRIYAEKGTILTLCTICRGGFHEKCRNLRFVNKDGTLKDQTKVKKQELFMNPYMYANAGYSPNPFYYPFPPPPQIKHDGQASSYVSEDED